MQGWSCPCGGSSASCCCTDATAGGNNRYFPKAWLWEPKVISCCQSNGDCTRTDGGLDLAMEDIGTPHAVGNSPSPVGAGAATGLLGCTLGDEHMIPSFGCHLARTTGSCFSLERCICTLPEVYHEFPALLCVEPQDVRNP